MPQAIAGANFHIGIIAGKVERRDAGDDAQRLAQRIEVDAGAGAVGIFALQQMRDAAGELDHFEAALDVAAGVGNRLAVLGGEQRREAVEFLLHQVEKLEHARARGAAGWWRPRPAAPPARIGDRVLDLGMLGQRDPRLDLAGIGIEDVAEAARPALDGLAADEMADLTHRGSPVAAPAAAPVARMGLA